MKTLIARCALSATALAAGAALAGDADTSRHHNPGTYHVANLDTFGGTDSAGNSINNLGMVTGFSHLPSDQHRHASLWLYGLQIDLGTLGDDDRNSNVPWPGKNNRGLIAGISQTNTPQPRGETWSCRSFFPFATRAGYTCLGFAWERGEMRALPTLGGDNGFATGTNNRGQIVGWAENTVEDRSCVAPQVLQFRAVIWGPKKHQQRELPPLSGHSTSAATAINEKGQVVGISGACGTAVGGVSARNAVLWENGKAKMIPSLGGIAWNTAMAINERGDVAGFSNVSEADGSNFNAQAFFWNKRAGLQRIGVLPGTDISQALGMNNHGQVVGTSCTADFSVCRAFLWEKGVIKELNDLVAGDYPDTLVFAGDINDSGRITGSALVSANNELRTFLAIPGHRGHGHDSNAVAPAKVSSGAARTATVLPAAARRALMDRLFVTEADLVR